MLATWRAISRSIKIYQARCGTGSIKKQAILPKGFCYTGNTEACGSYIQNLHCLLSKGVQAYLVAIGPNTTAKGTTSWQRSSSFYGFAIQTPVQIASFRSGLLATRGIKFSTEREMMIRRCNWVLVLPGNAHLNSLKAVFVTFYFARNQIELFQELKTVNKKIARN